MGGAQRLRCGRDLRSDPPHQPREPDLSYLLDAASRLCSVLTEGQLIVLESTTYPGTTRERLAPILERSGLKAGDDFNLAFSPERIDPGRLDFTVENTPKVVGGLTEHCAERARDLYESLTDRVVLVSTPEAAELTKLLENIFRSVNIALVNELAQLCDRMSIDIWEVIDAASSKPFGFMRFEPGPGMGGHCLPVDPFYLAFKAREHEFYTEFIELAGKTNQAQPLWCVRKIGEALNQVAKPLSGADVCLLGVAYKAGIGDIRESPALKMIDRVATRRGDRRELSRSPCARAPGSRIGVHPHRSSARERRRDLHRHGSRRGGLREGGPALAAGRRLPRRYPASECVEPHAHRRRNGRVGCTFALRAPRLGLLRSTRPLSLRYLAPGTESHLACGTPTWESRGAVRQG